MKLLNTSDLDVIKILGLTATGKHGVYPSERRDGQPFRVDVIMHVDTRSAATDDDLSRTVDYSEVAADVNAILAGPPVYLIETLAQRVAEAVLKYEPVQIVEVEVHKPDAPIDYEFKDVSMTIRRSREELDENRSKGQERPTASVAGMGRPPGEKAIPVEDDDLTKPPRDEVRAIIAFGANLGTPWQTLGQAVIDLDNAPGVSITGVSALFRTAPVLGEEQDPQNDYYNAVAEVRTSLSPLGLLAVIQQIESDHGRVRTEHWGPRTLDLDIITYEGIRSDDPKLILPHPRAHERAFVLEPWLQVDQNATVGRHGRVDVLVEQVRDQEIEHVADFWVEQAAQGIYPGEEEVHVGLIQPSESVLHSTPVPSEHARASVPASADRGYNGTLGQSSQEPASAESPSSSRSDVRRPRHATDGVEAQAQTQAQQIGESEPRHLAGTEPQAKRALPNWHRRKPQRIVDDADELFPIEPKRPIQRRAKHRPRPRMESGLADDFATGLIPITEPPTRISRRTIMRPTVTGAIPVVKPGEEEGEIES